MKASLRFLTLCLLLLVPAAAARAQGPSLTPISNVTMNAGSTFNIGLISVDLQDRPITLTAALPPFATLNTPTIGTGFVMTSLSLAPSAGQVGDYSAEVTATAGGVATVRVFQITVNAAGSNQAPIVTAPSLEGVMAGSTVSFSVTADDADGDPIASLSASGVPTGATFTPNGSNTSATFAWTPGVADAGEYDIIFTAANALSGSSVTHIRVMSPPTLMITPIDDVTVAGGASLSVPVHASGVPDALITLTAALPAFATLNPPGSGTGVVNTTVTISPPTGSAGRYHASITAVSLGASVTEPFDIIVTGDVGGSNHPPVLTAPATETVAIGSTLTFDISATDPDGDHVDLNGTALPPGSSFTDHANDTGTFSWTPVAGQGGTYTASFTGTDGKGGSGSASTLITVTGDVIVNHPPTVSAPATSQVIAGQNLLFAVTASDPDGDHVTLSASSMPSGANFLDHGDNTGAFSWTPDATQVGTYTVAFLGFDGKGGSGTANANIEVVAASTGGGGEIPGAVCLVGKFKAQRDTTRFRLKAVHHSFDLSDVDLSSIRLWFGGQSLPALTGARIQIVCDDDRNHHGNGGDDHHGKAVTRMNANHGDQGDDDQGEEDHCGVSCDDAFDHDNGLHEGHEHEGECDTLGILVPFSTAALIQMFEGATVTADHASHDWKRPLPCALMDARMLATLKSGEAVVARFGDADDDHGHGHGDDDHGHGQGGDGEENALSAKLKPNPLHPSTVLSFATKLDGQVRVVVYDMQGRVVKRLLDEFRTAGPQTLGWDGTNEWNMRVASGVYFLRIQAPEASVTRRVAMVK